MPWLAVVSGPGVHLTNLFSTLGIASILVLAAPFLTAGQWLSPTLNPSPASPLFASLSAL
jgi:hypothetical protein